MGALFAAVALYPLDVVKTRQQVDVDGASNTENSSHELTKKKNMWMVCYALYQTEGLEGLFAGLSSKILHTVFSNFAYFYWYSFLVQSYEKKSGKKISTGWNLILASLAGALNMSMTLPLEMINTRACVQANDNEKEGEEEQEKGFDGKDGSASYSKPTSKVQHHKSMLEISKEIYAENGIFSFWKGFIPSLVLVSNPSINFTVFDRLKLQLQRLRMKKTGAKRLASLSALEAFVLAAVAKAIATIVTYPVIRAKVLMQAQKSTKEEKKPKSTSSHPIHTVDMGNSMIQVLQRIGEVEGPSGYFKGCQAQLFNTVLKSALLVMTKEQITKYTMRVLYALSRKNQ
jgi:hypothetical protein